jgi:N-acylneuraminate cytidylyltransferase
MKTDFAEPYNMPRQQLPQTYWQTGHVEAIRFGTITEKHSLTGTKIVPFIIDSRYSIDIDTLDQWATAEWVLAHQNLDLVRPFARRSLPADIRMLVLDFDGVLTDNRVLVLDDGREAVACSRSDGMGLEELRARGIGIVVLSKEANPVVSARCKKLNITCHQGIAVKAPVFKDLVFRNGATFDQVVYVGNDVNDLECMRLAGFGVAVADAHPDVLRAADWILAKPGGHGAVRELSDLIIASIGGIR